MDQGGKAEEEIGNGAFVFYPNSASLCTDRVKYMVPIQLLGPHTRREAAGAHYSMNEMVASERRNEGAFTSSSPSRATGGHCSLFVCLWQIISSTRGWVLMAMIMGLARNQYLGIQAAALRQLLEGLTLSQLDRLGEELLPHNL